MILEKKDVQFFTVTESKTSNQVVLHLKGLVMHSSMGISKVDQISDQNNYVILVHLVLARRGVDGNMNFEINVPSNVDTVLFGNTHEIIWKRDHN